jgi:hypothetical protein
MRACNFLFHFIPKELFYVENNSSKYELKPGATLPCRATCGRHRSHVVHRPQHWRVNSRTIPNNTRPYKPPESQRQVTKLIWDDFTEETDFPWNRLISVVPKKMGGYSKQK